MSYITMYDSVTVSAIPADAEAVAGYTSGLFPTWKALVSGFPKAKRLSIAINSTHDAECLDVENGDATPADALAWFRQQKIILPCFYANLSTMPAVVQALTDGGIRRYEYRLWVAHYDNVASVPAGFDAKQYSDKALGRNLDISVCHPEFFGRVVDPFIAPDEQRWIREYMAVNNKNGAWPALRRRVLKRTMVHRERLIVELAAKTGWSILNRRDRYRALLLCTQAR